MAVGRKTGGRKKGTPNKTTAAVKDMILEALNDRPGGGVAYLKLQAAENPNAFMSLLGKILPTQLTGENGGPISVSSPPDKIEMIVIEHSPSSDSASIPATSGEK